MQLDWSTIALEVVNFLVLVWLLRRFLYRPILAVVAKRQATIEQAASRASEAEAHAHDLEARCEARLRDWERERAQALARLQAELQAERQRALAALDKSLEQEREKARVLEERRAAEDASRREREALEQAGRFVQRLLAGLASPQLEAGLARAAIAQIAALPDETRSRLKAALAGTKEAAHISSAFTLPDDLRKRLVSALDEALGGPREWRFREDRSLLAGVRVSVGAWALHFNLAEELDAFGEAARDER